MTHRDLIEKLCRCLAFHVIETELTRQFMEPPAGEPDGLKFIDDQIADARNFIHLAGFDIDVLCPIADRPEAVPALEERH